MAAFSFQAAFFSVDQWLIQSQPGRSQQAPSCLHFLICQWWKWVIKYLIRWSHQGRTIFSFSLCELESVWLTLLMGSRELSWSLTKWVCADISPAAGLYAGGNMPSLSPPVFPLDSVQRALGAKRGEEEVLGIFFFEESQCSLAVIAGNLRVGWSHTLRSRQKSVPGHS